LQQTIAAFTIAQCWRRNWEHVAPFFAFPESVRGIYDRQDSNWRD
jgi:transposase-like protein